MKAGSKYYPLYAYLRQSGAQEITLTFDSVETMLGEPLPASARRQRGWWSNRSTGAVQARAWMGAGYHVAALDLAVGQVTFRKPQAAYSVQRVGDIVLWDGDMIKALRHHMGLSQAKLADELGVRQQTISEWETGAYQPKRALSKLLAMVAEQANFPYDEEG